MAKSNSATDRAIKLKQIEILSIAEGFLQSSVLFTLVKLEVFQCISKGIKTLEDLAAAIDTKPETLSRLLNAGVVLNLLESRDGGRFQINPKYRDILSPDAGETYLGDWIASLDNFFSPISKLDEAIKTSGPTTAPDEHIGGDKESTRSFMLSMHNYASLRGKELADFLDTSGCKSLLDIGCGPGTYAYHLGMRNPKLELYLADHPTVLETTMAIQDRYDLKNKIHYIPIDVMEEDINGRYDLILVSNMLHGLGEQNSRQLINRLYNAINDQGSLVIQAQFLNDDRFGPRWPVLLDLVQLCVTKEGRNHAPEETKQWMQAAGFSDIEFKSMTLLNTNSFLRGYKRNIVKT